MKLPSGLTNLTPLSKVIVVFALIFIAIAAFLFGNNYQQNVSSATRKARSSPQSFVATKSATATAPNPAAIYCVSHSGKSEIKTNVDGSYGLCVFTDGSVCDEWRFFKGQCKPGQVVASISAGFKFYTSSQYGFTLQYLSTITLNESSADDIFFTFPNTDSVRLSVEKDFKTLDQDSRVMSLSQFAVQQIGKGCYEDSPGPNGTTSISCDQIISQKPFTTSTELKGFIFAMNKKEKSGKKITFTPMKPIYALDINAQTKGKARFLLINPWYNGNWSSQNNDLLDALINSIEFGK